MPYSTKLATASYITAYIAAHHPDLMTSDKVAEAVADHPTRVRQFVAMLVKAGLLRSLRGSGGGLALAREPDEITLLDIYVAVEDSPALSVAMRENFTGWGASCHVDPILRGVFDKAEGQFRALLAGVPLTALYTPKR